MLRHHHCLTLSSVACLTAAVTVLTACSNPAGTRPATVAATPAAGQLNGQTGDQTIGVSPGGVITTIDVPAESTEEQYAKSCAAAKEWMAAKGGDPHDLIEPYLKDVQESTSAGPVTFSKSWPELSTAQRAAVIIAVRAAADGGC